MGSVKENILVSIITVCYNSEKTIERTVKSMLSQSYSNYEYLIVDGKSTDKTLDIVRQYEPLFQGRMRVISEADQGIYDAMNKGISLASGELIGMINSDDYYEADALEIMVGEYLKKREPHMILYGFQRNFQGEREKSTVLFHHDFLVEQMITHPTCFVTKKVYEDFGKFDLSYRSSADYEFMLRLYQKQKVVFHPVYKVIANFQMGGMSSSQVGYRETLGLQYQYGGMTKGRYLKLKLKSHLYELLHGR
ncbi:MAG: glycosyltransferase [Lachnospiraceae bacterium]|nr:glycosyltransferase [Lachnospiraceae bacterium]